jgi:hypothetical protein
VYIVLQKKLEEKKSFTGWSFVRIPEQILKFSFVEKFYKYGKVFQESLQISEAYMTVKDDYDHHDKCHHTKIIML